MYQGEPDLIDLIFSREDCLKVPIRTIQCPFGSRRFGCLDTEKIRSGHKSFLSVVEDQESRTVGVFKTMVDQCWGGFLQIT